MSKRLPLEVEFLQRERESILREWRARLESSVNRHFFSSSGVSAQLIDQVFDDIVSAVDKNLYRNLNLSFDDLLRDGRHPGLPVSNVRDFMFQFVPAARTVLQRSHPEGEPGPTEVIYQRFKVIERDIRGVYSERMARNLIQVMQQQRQRVLERWMEDLPTAIVSDHFSVLDEEDRRQFVSETYDICLAMLKGEEQELLPPQGDQPQRNRLQGYLHRIVEYFEPKGFLVSDMQRALNYPLRLLEPHLYHRLNHTVPDYRVALLSLVDVLQTLTQTFSEAYSERQMKNYYNEVSIMLHRIKNKLTPVVTTMETILMIPKEGADMDEADMVGDPMVITTPEAEALNDWLQRTDALLTLIGETFDEQAGENEDRPGPDAAALQAAWRDYQAHVQERQAVIDNVRYKLDVSTMEMVNELLNMAYEAGRVTNELAMELQLRQNELYQREPPRRVEMDIYDLVKRAYEESVPEAQSRNQTYELSAEDRGVYVFGVEAELKRPFIQIIENAIKYTPVGGTVTVRLEYEPNHILFAVKDTGIGIPPGEEGSVFGLCERCSNATEFNKSGTGTGLYNDRKTILHHNGEIWVESEGVGKGSTFFIRLPIHSRKM